MVQHSRKRAVPRHVSIGELACLRRVGRRLSPGSWAGLGQRCRLEMFACHGVHLVDQQRTVQQVAIAVATVYLRLERDPSIQ